ncbi:trypsin-like serine peptidase [Amycolatopsis panacis]|uniref:Peptidase S1 domain-containing protein n=1 Tax=Amycolatopsis panacis TaxID=2340917 RepID=A0A419IA09_9PSEU|nr:hypothetical protein [Amycolatopsis panacis]RJQ89995.1 hypothetical protein D5S19_03275 [Amycolatopsis panacis]
MTWTQSLPGLAVLAAGLTLAPAANGPLVQPMATSAAAEQAVFDYWTPSRIAALTEPSSGKPPKSGADGAPWTSANAAQQTVGRLFYTDHGEDASCTATVVDSANRSTIVTAAHCVNNTDLIGEHNAWNAHLMFVPGYHDGQAPYGKFAVRYSVADATWLKNDQQGGQFNTYDQAFAVLGTNSGGKRVQDAVGAAQRIGFDLPADAEVTQFGYPRASDDPAREGLPEYTGERLAYCTGQARHLTGTKESPDQWGTACVMGGGSSGGPRLRDFDPKTGLGTVIGDNSHSGLLSATGIPCEDEKTDGCTRYLAGPQFSRAVTEPLYEAAQKQS